MHEAAFGVGEDLERLSFVHAVRVIQRRLPRFDAIPPRQRKTFHAVVLDEILTGARQFEA
jgi:hypothetical protein